MMPLRSYDARLSLAALVVAGLFALSGCPITSTCRPGDITSPGCRCIPGDVRPECQGGGGTGGLSLTWTVNGQPANVGCAAANATQVQIAVGSATPVAEACATGARTFAGLPVGALTLVADLLDASNAKLVTITQSVTIVANVNTPVALNFMVGGGQVGGVKFRWTVNGQDPATACPPSSTVAVASTAQPGATVTQQFPCTAGSAGGQIDNLAPGDYTFRATLTDPANPSAQHVVDNLTVTVVAGSLAEPQAFNFDLGGGGGQTGSVTISWTVNGGQFCPRDASQNPTGTVTINVSGGPTSVSPSPSSGCDTYRLQIPSLAPGTYTFDLVLSDTQHSETAVSQAAGVNVVAGADAAIAVNFTCSFCPTM